MARASIKTWLPLDTWAQLMGIQPAHFNGVYSSVFPDTTGCSSLWMQYPWQNGGALAREDVAQAIHDAEQDIANYVGYNLLPDWAADEQHRTVRPARVDVINRLSRNQRGFLKSVQTHRAHVISGGVKAVALIGNFAVARVDLDGDGYNETATVTVASTAQWDEVRIFSLGSLPLDEWEIRPTQALQSVDGSGNPSGVMFYFKIWQIPDTALWETQSTSASGIDGDVAANFDTQVTAYRIYNDPQTQVQFLWEEPECSNCGGTGCTACQFATQDGCLKVRDTRQGFVTYEPATWDATNEHFDSGDWAESREPDRLRLWYYSGWNAWSPPVYRQNTLLPDPVERVVFTATTMDPYWQRAVAYMAAARLNIESCSCDTTRARIARWQEDLALVNSARSYQNGARVLENPFGTRRGEVYAWQAANADGRKVARQ